MVNIGGLECVLVLKVVFFIEDIFGKKVILYFLDKIVGELSKMWVDILKVKQFLYYNFVMFLKDGLVNELVYLLLLYQGE